MTTAGVQRDVCRVVGRGVGVFRMQTLARTAYSAVLTPPTSFSHLLHPQSFPTLILSAPPPHFHSPLPSSGVTLRKERLHRLKFQ